MRHPCLYRLLLPALLLFAMGRVSYAQTSQITGRITDSSSAVILGANVTVTNVDTGISRQAVSNEQGYYTVPLLPPGKYRVTVQFEGFKPIHREGITLTVDQVARMDFVMEVGELTQVENVQASAPVLEKETSALGQLIDSKKVAELPLLGRNPYSLVALVPGARPPISLNNLPVDMFTSQFVSINGARGYQNEYLLDGVPNTNPGQSGPTIFPSVDSVQEFNVITNSYSAEYGRAAGGVFNVVTKSGTNEFHGSLYEFLRNDVLNANDFFANRAGKEKAPFRFNQFGFTAGGPVFIPGLYNGKNRTFLFGNYEGVRQRQGVTFVGTVPTLRQRQGDFSQTLNARGELIRIFDPATTRPDPDQSSQFIRDPFPNNTIPDHRIDPVARALLRFLPLPNAPGRPVTGVSNFISSASQRINKDIFTIRMDHQVSERQRVSGRFSFDRSPWVRPDVYGNIGSPIAGPQVFSRRGAAFDDSYTINSTLMASFKYGFNRLTNVRFPRSLGIDLARLGFPADFARALQFPSLPGIQIAGFGGVTSIPNVGFNSVLGATDVILFGLDTHTWQGGLTKTRGRHTVKLGTEFRLIRNNETQRGDLANQFSFTPAFTQGPNPVTANATAGYAFASFLLGTANSGIVNIIPGVAIQNVYYGFYVHDDVKLTPKLTLNLGLRYEYESPRTERYNQLANFDFQATLPLEAPGLGLRGGLTFVGVDGHPRGQWEPDRNNFAPRFGFAYNLAPKMVMRGGFGIFFAPNFAGTGTGPTPFGLSGFSATTNFVGTLDGITPASFLRNPFPQGLNRPTGNRLGPATLLGESIAFVDRHNRTPYSEQWNLNVQQELRGHVLLEVAYVGSRGLKLYANRELNQLPDQFLSLGNDLREQVPNPFHGQIAAGALSRRTISRGQLLRPFPHFQSVIAANSTWGASTYHALQVKLERRFAQGVGLLVSYSFSKLLDDVTGAFAGEPLSGTGLQNVNNLKAERSVSALDVPQRLVLSYIWELPFGAGKKHLVSGWANRVLGGWQMEGIATFSSGNVLGITSASNTTFSFAGGQRPHWNGRNPALDKPSVDRWFNTSVFSQPPPYTFGNAPRTLASLRSHGTKNFDFSLIKNTRVGERINAQFRAEFFNLFNMPRFGVPNMLFGTPNFGVVSNQINSPRIVQFGLKVLF